MNLYHVIKFPLHLSLTVHYNYTKFCRFTPILSIRIVSSWFYLLISLNLTFAVKAMFDLSIFLLRWSWSKLFPFIFS